MRRDAPCAPILTKWSWGDPWEVDTSREQSQNPPLTGTRVWGLIPACCPQEESAGTALGRGELGAERLGCVRGEPGPAAQSNAEPEYRGLGHKGRVLKLPALFIW